MKERQHTHAKDILQRYVAGQCTDEERAWVEKWYKENYHTDFEVDSNLAEEHFAEIWRAVEKRSYRPKIHSLRRIMSLAASLLLILGIGGWYYWYNSSSEISQLTNLTQQQSIKAGRDQALLTLADGRMINLDSVTVGNDIIESGMIITKMSDGTLSYKIDASLTEVAKDRYNTISTPRGGQYKIVLPDHSVVWLNASSSLRFPIAFTGNTRPVLLEGEGYFEVAHDKNKPFIVSSQNQKTIVKGTKFNIAAYPDDEKKVTTLLEGSVLVVANPEHAKTNEILLRANEQTTLQNNTITKSNIDALEAIAWKNGKFIYNNTPLEQIMKQLARWYDVEVVYLEALEGITFTGAISRFDDIEDVLRKISLTESVRFETKERRVMVQH